MTELILIALFAVILVAILYGVIYRIGRRDGRRQANTVSWVMQAEGTVIAHSVINQSALLDAIAARESGDKDHPWGNPDAVGPEGELSRWQFTEATWNECTVLDFDSFARKDQWAREAAVRNLEKIMGNANATTLFDIAMAWRWPHEDGRRSGPSGAMIDYGNEVEALYWKRVAEGSK